MQITLRNLGLAVACLIVIGACTATTGPPRPISDASKRLEFNGFSLMPPQGAGWSVEEKGRHEVTFWKELWLDVAALEGGRSATAPRTFFMSMSILPPEGEAARPFTSDYMRSETERGFKGMQTPRMKLMSYKVEPYVMQGTECVRYEARFEELDHPQLPRGAVIEMTGVGFTCRHPSSPRRAIDGKYSERRLRGAPERPGETYRAEAEAALNSVTFPPPR